MAIILGRGARNLHVIIIIIIIVIAGQSLSQCP